MVYGEPQSAKVTLTAAMDAVHSLPLPVYFVHEDGIEGRDTVVLGGRMRLGISNLSPDA